MYLVCLSDSQHEKSTEIVHGRLRFHEGFEGNMQI